MPSRRAQAAFEPISPNLDIRHLVETTEHFEWATRVHCEMIDYHGMDQFEHLVILHVIMGGKPLVIEGYETKLDKWTYAAQWLRDNWGTKVVDARDLTANKNVPMTVQHYVKHMPLLTNQWDDRNYKDKDRQRIYLKDIDCPPMWSDKLRDLMPLGLYYLNDGTGDVGGFGAVDELDPSGPGVRKGRGIAKSGDLMSSLPEVMRAENLMCYVGHEGTYTPAHREMCASLGQNIMVEASTATIEDGKLTKPGTSLWFMTETKEREVVSEYWLSRLGHDIEIEKHFAQINAWKRAPFKVHVVEQKPGDLILIPPLAPHQVWNRGTRTMKVAWNRTTVETLEMAMEEALPKARMVCRDEQYKNKAIIYYTLQKYSKLLRVADKQRKSGTVSVQGDAKARQLQKDFKRLHNLFTTIMISESFLPDMPEKKVEFIPYDSNITCSYCRCNIFNRFLTCPSCIGKLPDGSEDTYDVCMDCYAMGRSCACISKLRWVEQWNWKELQENHAQFRRQIIELEGHVDSRSPRSLNSVINVVSTTRTLAQVCQNELLRRPYRDGKKEAAESSKRSQDVEREEIDEVDADGNVRKKKKIRRSEKYVREHGRCHVDCYWEPKWKQAQCSKCDKFYCYGNLFRAYDEMPQDIMANLEWQCPSCRRICGCRQCRHKPGFKQYTPKGTLLGHNTKLVADPRSVESLVDFSHPNIAWIRKAGDDHEEDTLRLRRRLRQAEAAKATDTTLGDNYVNDTDGNIETRLLQLAAQEGIPIDPALGMMNTADAEAPDSIEDEDAIVEHPEGIGLDVHTTSDIDLARIDVPEGGIMRDEEHAYEPTNYITYVYPDLAIPAQVPLPPSEGFVPSIVAGYEPAMPPEANDKIEMIERKRKRAKIDEGDRPYTTKKAMSKSKTRKSLVVKLAIDRDRLSRLVQEMELAKQAAKDATAPVVTSDLQALNLNSHASRPQPAPEQVQDEGVLPDDRDDDFTPSRYRDRRKPLQDGAHRPVPDAEITRRTTRMQAVTYAEPDEDEFDEVVEPLANKSKVATMELAAQDAEMANISHDSADDVEMDANEKHIDTIVPLQDSVEQLRSVTQSLANATSHGPRSAITSIAPATLRVPSASPSTSSTSSATRPDLMQSKVFAQAQANRQAKMAAIEGGSDSEEEEEDDDDDDDDDNESSKGEENSDNSSQDSTPPPIRPLQKQSVGSKAPRLSLPTSAVPRAMPPDPKVTPRPASVQKVSAADWGDSSSDDERPPVKTTTGRTSSSFVAVNLPGNHGNHAKPAVRGGPARRRGRPARAR